MVASEMVVSPQLILLLLLAVTADQGIQENFIMTDSNTNCSLGHFNIKDIFHYCANAPMIKIPGDVCDINPCDGTKLEDFFINNKNVKIYGELRLEASNCENLTLFAKYIEKVTITCNHNLQRFEWDVKSAGMITIRGNRLLTDATLQKIRNTKLIRKRNSSSSDIQKLEGECCTREDRWLDLRNCRFIHGDLYIHDMDLNRSSAMIEDVTGCINITNSILPEIFTNVSKNHTTSNNCTSHSVSNTCLSEDQHAALMKLTNNTLEYLPPSNCSVFCTPSSIFKMNQAGCTTLNGRLVITGTLEDSWKFIDRLNMLVKIRGGVEIRSSELLSPGDILPELRLIQMENNKPGLEIVNNSRLYKIGLHPDLIIDTSGISCTHKTVVVQDNPLLHMTRSLQQYLLKVADNDQICNESRADIQQIPKYNLPQREYATESEDVEEDPPDDDFPSVSDIITEETEQVLLSFWESEKPYWIFPSIVFGIVVAAIGLPLLLSCVFHRMAKQVKRKKDIQKINEQWKDFQFPKNLTRLQLPLTESESRRMMVFIEKLMATPVLRLREIVLRGIEKGEATAQGESRREKLVMRKRTDLSYGDNYNPVFRAELAKAIKAATVLPVYDCPMAEDLKLLHGKKKCNRAAKNFLCHTISRRVPPHKNENKFREAFDIWSGEEHKYYVIFGVGPADLSSYCGRSFNLTRIDRPEERDTAGQLAEDLEEAGIETTYYRCEYHSEKVRNDKKRRFIIEFHNIPIEREHPFSGNLAEMRNRPFVQLMTLAKELDIPVFCADPEIFFLLKLIHITFFYIFNMEDQRPGALGVHLAAIDMALDDLDLFSLAPADSVHVFALQLIDFCRVFIETKPDDKFLFKSTAQLTPKASSPAAGSKIISKPNSKEKITPAKSIPLATVIAPKRSQERAKTPADGKRKGAGVDKLTSPMAKFSKSFDAYIYATLKVDRVIQESRCHLTINWAILLPEEEKYKRYVSMEETSYMMRPFNCYYIELQPELKELRKKFDNRQVEYEKRRKTLHRLIQSRNEEKAVGKKMSTREEEELPVQELDSPAEIPEKEDEETAGKDVFGKKKTMKQPKDAEGSSRAVGAK